MSEYIYARVVSIAPMFASDGKKTYEVVELPDDISEGDWCKFTKNDGIIRYHEKDTPSDTPFPGREWRKFQTPGTDGRTRMDALKFRSEVLSGTRKFFTDSGYFEVETPLVVSSPGVETHLNAVNVSGNKFLSPSPEFQMKRLLAGGSGSIFQITKCFRQDETGKHHNPEFTMIEWYHVGADAETLRCDVEDLVDFLIEYTGNPGKIKKPPYKRMTMKEAFLEYASVDDYNRSPKELFKMAGINSSPPEKWEDAFFQVFVEKVEPHLSDNGPCFLTHWPKEFASLSRLDENDSEVAERFEFFSNGLEIANGFHELTDYKIQTSRSLGELEERKISGKPLYPLDNLFLESLKEGMPDTAGIALGMDRLVMLLWGTDDISNVLSFNADEL
ncbi:MAG: EF-P lysine aminoacylase GenX [Deltaproteobacteria bacterium]|nr:EF-P lysine aminoacylase GenX [Deltaproteobacteria bacterium]